MALRDRVSTAAATATLATVATVEGGTGRSVASVATVTVATPGNSLSRQATVRQSAADLLALVERVALAYRTPPGELAEMKRLALADPSAAWSAFLATARTEGIQ